MRSPVAVRLRKALSLLCAALLCCSLLPITAFASQKSLSLIPEGGQGTVRIPSGAEGGAPDTFSHCASDGAPSVDADGAVTSSENVSHNLDNEPMDDATDGPSPDGDTVFSAVVALEPIDDPVDPDAASQSAEGENAAADDASLNVLSDEQERIPYAQNALYNIVFDANGGDYAPVGAAYKAAFGGGMPSIESALRRADDGTAVPPKRERYVFMGFYDGSDWTASQRFYTRDFTIDDTCQKTYPYAADGLRLYAGWAPVLDVTVPASISISVGSVAEMDAPSIATDAIVNRSPWPVRCTSLTWDAEEMAPSDDALLVDEVRYDASSLAEMFSDPSGVYLSLAPMIPSIAPSEVQPGGSTALPQGSALTVAAAPEQGEARLSIDYTLRLSEDVEVTATEKVSTTRLLTPFEAVVEPSDDIRCSVLFSANGGEGGQSKSLDALFGEVPPALSDTIAPTYEGYEFMGWFDDPVWTQGTRYYDETGEPAEGAVWDKKGACVLYAGWKAKGCTVVLVAGPAGSTASMDYDKATPSKTYEVAYGMPLSSIAGFASGLPVPYWEGGYAFCGWWTERSGGREVTAEEIARSYAEPTVLYGRWSGFPVAVEWDACGGSEVETWRSHPAGSALGSLPATSRLGYTFVGWYDRASGGERIGEDTVVNDGATFYAHWDANTITLSWDLDGQLTSTYQTYSDEATVMFPSGLATPSKGNGWRFRGWYAKDAATQDPTGDRVTTTTPLPSENAAYTAFWEAEVTFDANGGAFADGSTATTSYQNAGGTSTLTLPQEPTYPDADFDLVGWYSERDGGTKVDGAFPVAAPVTFYAHWSGPALVSFDGNGHTGGTVPAAIKAFEGVAAKIPEAKPERIGYDFLGWSASKGAVEASWRPGDDYVRQSEAPVTLFAVWAPTAYGIIYNLAGGSASNPGSYTIESEAIALANPVRTGYAFQGWTGTGLSGPTMTVTIPKGTTGNRSYTATWKINVYTITYNTNGLGSVMNPLPSEDQRRVNHGATYTIITTEPTRSGYEFLGWSESAAATTATYCPGASIANVTSNKTLYAVWRCLFSSTPSVPSGDDGDFYLYLDADQAKAVSTGTIALTAGYYGASQIKSAAKDIADKGTLSDFYGVFQKIMTNDYKFISKWKNVSGNNATTVLTTSTDYEVRVIGLRQDRTNSAGTTFAGITFQFADNCLTYYCRFNYGGTNLGGWEKSELRARMNSSDAGSATQSAMQSGSESARSSIWNRAPQGIQTNVQPVYKANNNTTTGGKSTVDTVTYVRDQLFIASYAEMIAGSYYSTWETTYPWLKKEGVSETIYQYWKQKNTVGGTAGNASLVKKAKTSGGWGAYSWWERTALPGGTDNFLYVLSNGVPLGSAYASTAGNASGERAVAPCFCF